MSAQSRPRSPSAAVCGWGNIGGRERSSEAARRRIPWRRCPRWSQPCPSIRSMRQRPSAPEIPPSKLRAPVRIAHAPAREGVFDCAGVELAFHGLVFRDVHEPELAHPLGDERMSGAAVLINDGAGVVTGGWTGVVDLAAFLPEHAPPAVARCDAPPGSIGHRLTGLTVLVVRGADVRSLRGYVL